MFLCVTDETEEAARSEADGGVTLWKRKLSISRFRKKRAYSSLLMTSRQRNVHKGPNREEQERDKKTESKGENKMACIGRFSHFSSTYSEKQTYFFLQHDRKRHQNRLRNDKIFGYPKGKREER